jgi:hypothetical protein
MSANITAADNTFYNPTSAEIMEAEDGTNRQTTERHSGEHKDSVSHLISIPKVLADVFQTEAEVAGSLLDLRLNASQDIPS